MEAGRALIDGSPSRLGQVARTSGGRNERQGGHGAVEGVVMCAWWRSGQLGSGIGEERERKRERDRQRRM